MSNLGVDNIKGSDGNNGPLISGNVVFSGTSHIVLPKGTTAQRPTGVAAGSLRFNTDTKLVEQYNGTSWVTLNSYGVGRGVFGGGYTTSSPFIEINTIDYITIASQGTDASDFGDLTTTKSFLSGCSSSTRGIFMGSAAFDLSIDYITIATTGNATDFGNTITTSAANASCSSSTRGIFAIGGLTNTPTLINSNVLEYITIATTGNATDFGDLTAARRNLSSCSSSTRGVFVGGSGGLNIIEYITIATTGNATDFGDLTVARATTGACSSSTRGVFGGGYTPTNVNTIDYITIATTGNAINFGGILTQSKSNTSSCSSSTRGVFGGGYATPTRTNIIDYITISSQGTNAQDFGDLTTARGALAALSDAHGGLS